MKLIKICCVLLASTMLMGCSIHGQKSGSPFSELREQIKKEFEVEPGPIPIPENNPQTPEKVALGEALFFDPNLSSCGDIACATCHLPEKGFGDGERVSTGCNGVTGRRNSNALYQVAYLSHLFWDGRVQSLEQQALGPITDPDEMANSWDNVISYLNTGEHPVTGKKFPQSALYYQKAFGQVFDHEINTTNVAKALAAYQRTIVSRDSPFDRWIQGDDSAMTTSQKRGASIFFGRGRCSQCHPPPHFTDSDFHNVAVPKTRFQNADMFPENQNICGGIREDLDPGRAEIPFLQSSCSDLGKFRTPSLRNIELSSPYMHNGKFSALEDVMRHYWNVGRGTGDPLLGTLDKKAQTIMLTDFGGHPMDFINLSDFLKALTGTQISGPASGIAPPQETD